MSGEIRDEDFPFGRPTREEDVPIDSSQMNPSLIREMELKEREDKRKDQRYFSAFKLIVGCMIMLGLIYFIDTIMNAVLNQNVSEITDSVVEIIKTMIFTLSGYLFAKKEG